MKPALLMLACCATLVCSSARAEDGWGTITGQIAFNGDAIPERKEINVDKEKEHCLSKGKLFDEEWIVNKKNKGVANVFVWLVDATDPKKKLPINPALAKPPTPEVVLDQPCCQFVPHVIALREGQVLVAKNSAPISHNINYQGGKANPGKNVIIGPSSEVKISELVASNLPIVLACNIHGWMKGYVRVFDHPYYAVSDADGKFTIKLAPAGEYRLVVWHEGVGWGPGGKDGQKITIKPSGTTDLGKIEIKPE